jgi:ABC-type transport system involved in multi-copper enzyme maturation permease subunit
MSRPSVLRAMMVKELRTMLRERGQFFGLVGGIVAMLAGFFVPSYQLGKSLGHYVHTSPAAAPGMPSGGGVQLTAPQPLQRQQLAAKMHLNLEQFGKVVRWVAVAMVLPLSVFISIMFGTTMAVAAFVGEKEASTVEVLLAAPLSHARLFVLKYLSVIIPAAVLTMLLVAIGVALLGWAAWQAMPHWLLEELLGDLVWATPVPLLCVAVMNGLCIAASMGAETVKGAGQMVGVVLLVVMMPLVLIPVLMTQWFVPMREAVFRFGGWWLGAPFITQYAALMGVGLGFAVVFFAVAYVRFDREWMLV